MATSDHLLSALAVVILFTSFIKVATALSVLRFGAGLTGIEFGVVTIAAAFGIAIGTMPPELGKLGYPGALFTPQSNVTSSQLFDAVSPFLKARIDPEIDKSLSTAPVAVGENGAPELPRMLPAFIVSELKSALTAGCYLLVPFVIIDLLIAHVLMLVGIQNIGAHVVSLPLKLLLFLSVDGWTLLTKKLLEA